MTGGKSVGEIEEDEQETNRHSFSLLRCRTRDAIVSPDTSSGGSVCFWEVEDNYAPPDGGTFL
jgi:hypothetical protein